MAKWQGLAKGLERLLIFRIYPDGVQYIGMKAEDVKAMSDEELRVKVAQLDGWKSEVDSRDLTCICVTWTKGNKVVPGNGHLPDYPQDLNSMHEAEKVLKKGLTGTRNQKSTYRLVLYRILQAAGEDAVEWGHATARQRAEAFVLAMEDE